MKWKLILFSLFFGCTYWACNDTLDSIGMGILPDQDKINVYTDTISLDASTVKVDSIYAKSINGLLGQFYDPLYGNLKSGYICQFYAPENNAYSDSIIDNKIDSIVLRIYYSSSLGDTLAPMEATAYPVVKPLDKHYYTNMDPAKYCDLSTVYGRQTYTARNLNVSDSLYKAGYGKSVSIRLPDNLGQKFYDEWRKPAPNAYSSLSAFTQFFPGIYVATTYGTGNILYVTETDIVSFYKILKTTKDVSGNDSTYIENSGSMFNVTKEIIQLNSYKNSHDDQLLIPNVERAFIKTPAGVFTKVTIPIPEIVAKMGKKKFSSAKLTLSTFGQEQGQYPLGFPPKLLLINPDSVTTFFENKQIANNQTSFSTSYSGNYSYSFGNISNAIQNAIDNGNGDKNLELLVIPIQTQASSGVDYSTEHYLSPSGVSFKKGKAYMKLEVVATDMDVNQLDKNKK